MFDKGFLTQSIGNIIGDIIGLCIHAILAPTWFNNLSMEEDETPYTIFFRVIYPKWLSFKKSIRYNILRRKLFRHIQYERKRLIIGVMFRN